MQNAAGLESPPHLVLCAATAADLMTPNPLSIAATATVKEAAAFLTDKGFSVAPVIDEAGRPVGVVSQSDILIHDREGGEGRSGHPEAGDGPDARDPSVVWVDVVNGDLTQVRDIMAPTVFSVAPDTPAQQVIDDMLGQRIHRLFVVDTDGILVGVISTVDVLRHLHWEHPSSESAAGSPTRGGR
jgi:CBS domain-containing protein